jgi:ABC-type branched-subunit amino acid transport system ATPase component
MKLVETIRASGVTILLVEHDMPMVMQVSDRIVVSTTAASSLKGPGRNPETIPTSSAPIWERERSVLELRDVVCRYGQVTALKGVSITVGKAARRADRRQRRRQDHDLEDDLGTVAPDRRHDRVRRARHHPCLARAILSPGIAHCPEGRHVFPHMTVLENLEMGCLPAHDRPANRGRLRAISISFRASPNGGSSRPEPCRAASSRCWRSGVR